MSEMVHVVKRRVSYQIRATLYPIADEESAQSLSLITEHEFSFDFTFNRSLLRKHDETLKEKFKRLKTNMLNKFSKDHKRMYNIRGIEFEGLKKVLVEIDIPINESSDFIKVIHLNPFCLGIYNRVVVLPYL
ncbi:unnamed protein product [Meloidogyne enterolobii]|uniref:Uncharacterized protein n=1 Tax=Meloidogyne enterolobii TaxID=390850 RepID=A0ACB0ZL54_MELEN